MYGTNKINEAITQRGCDDLMNGTNKINVPLFHRSTCDCCRQHEHDSRATNRQDGKSMQGRLHLERSNTGQRNDTATFKQ